MNATRNLLTGIVPWDIYLSLKQHNIWQLVWTHSDVLLDKLCSGWLLKNWRDLFGPEFVWLGPLFLVCVFAARSRLALSFWLFCFGGFLLNFLAYSITVTVVRFYRPFTPLLLVVVVGSGATLLRCLPQRFHFILLLTSLAVVVMSSVPFLKEMGRHPAKQQAKYQEFGSIRSAVDPGTVVASNRSWFIAWYSDRPTVHFNGSILQLEAIDRYYTQIGAIYLEGIRARLFKRRLNRNPIRRQFRIARKFSRGATLWVRKRAGPPNPQ
jgi:hypothetical protein